MKGSPVSKNNTPDNEPGLFAALHRIFTLDERRRFILLFLVINVLIFILIWLSWQNRVLVQKNQVLVQEKKSLETQLVVAETRVVEKVVTCEVDCTDRMSTVAAKVGTEMAQTTATLGALFTRSPTPGTPTVTPTPVPTPTDTSTPTPVPTATPTPVPTPTNTPTPTPIPIDTPTPLTVIPPPPPPTMLSITPTMTVRSIEPIFPVTITGQNFSTSGVGARLGADTYINVTGNTTTTITGTLSPDMPVGVYGLTVTNLDNPDPPGTLSPAFTVYDSYGITIPLESPYLVTFGANAKSPYDTPRYQTQVISFEVPSALTESLYVRIFDADTGGPSFVDDDQDYDGYDTTMRYTLYGLTGTLQTTTISESVTLDDNWDFFLGPFSPDQGVPVGDRYIFELEVKGLSGKDANWYRVALSTSSVTNTVRSDVQMFAFSWTVLVNEARQPHPCLHAYVREGETTFRLGSSGCRTPEGRLLIRTPFRNLEVRCSNEERKFTPGGFGVEVDEHGMTWAVDLSDYTILDDKSQYLVFWGESDSAMPIFTRPMTAMSP